MSLVEFNNTNININRLMQLYIDEGGRLELVVGNGGYYHLDLLSPATVKEQQDA